MAQNLQRLVPVCRFDGIEATETQGITDELAHTEFIINDHHQGLHAPIPS